MQPDFSSLLILGIINGASVCAFSCLPLIGPYVLGAGKGAQHGMLSFLTFGSGKLVGYSVLGGLATFVGHVLPPDFSTILRSLSGFFLIVAAFSILWGKRKSCSCKTSSAMGGASLFGVGLSTSLVPCPALGAVFFTAAQQSSILMGMTCGALFSLGLLFSPLLLFSGGLGVMGEHFSRNKNIGRLVTVVSMTVMVTTGLRMILFKV